VTWLLELAKKALMKFRGPILTREYLLVGKEHSSRVSPSLPTLKVGYKAVIQMNEGSVPAVLVRIENTHGKLMFVFRKIGEKNVQNCK